MPTTTTVIDHLNAFNHNTMFKLTEFKVLLEKNSFVYYDKSDICMAFLLHEQHVQIILFFIEQLL
jgi:hypothetical protein